MSFYVSEERTFVQYFVKTYVKGGEGEWFLQEMELSTSVGFYIGRIEGLGELEPFAAAREETDRNEADSATEILEDDREGGPFEHSMEQEGLRILQSLPSVGSYFWAHLLSFLPDSVTLHHRWVRGESLALSPPPSSTPPRLRPKLERGHHNYWEANPPKSPGTAI